MPTLAMECLFLEKSCRTTRAMSFVTTCLSTIYETMCFGSSVANTYMSVAAAVHQST